MIIVNFKKYKTGAEAIKLAKTCEKVAKETKSRIIIAVLPYDLPAISKTVKIPVYSQYINNTITAKWLKTWGKPKGTLLNHADNPISNEILSKLIKEAHKGIFGKLKVIACCTTTKRAKEIERLKPDYIAIEPKALIGSKKSVSKTKPELIKKTVEAVKIPVLCGAGIHNKEDVKKALELGAKGVLVASAVAKAKNPGKVLRELTKDLK